MAEPGNLIGFRFKDEALFGQPGIRAQIQLLQGVCPGKLLPNSTSGILFCFHKHLLIKAFGLSAVLPVDLSIFYTKSPGKIKEKMLFYPGRPVNYICSCCSIRRS
jgi:hypothetical protein